MGHWWYGHTPTSLGTAYEARAPVRAPFFFAPWVQGLRTAYLGEGRTHLVGPLSAIDQHI